MCVSYCSTFIAFITALLTCYGVEAEEENEKVSGSSMTGFKLNHSMAF